MKLAFYCSLWVLGVVASALGVSVLTVVAVFGMLALVGHSMLAHHGHDIHLHR